MDSGRLLLAIVAALLLGCSPPPHETGRTLNRGNGPDIKSLDPAFVQGLWESFVVGDMLMGLTTEGPRGEPVPGAADGWNVSPDGLTWTFHIRSHRWSDGTPVTAADFVAAWRRLVDPNTAAPYAYNLWIVKNGEAVSTGRLPPSALGVRAQDDCTLVVTLEHPASYLPELLDIPAAWPLPRHVLRRYPKSWTRPEHYVTNGPYIVREWIPGDHITLVKNPRFYDAAHVAIDTVNYYQTSDANAGLRRFRAGQLDTLYQFPSEEIDWLRRHLPQAVRTSAYLGVAYFAVNIARFPDRRIREAINLGLDRQALTEKIRRVGETPAYRIVPPGISGYPGHAGLDFESVPMASRIARARALMKALGYGEHRPLHMQLLTTVSPDSKRNAAAFQAMMAKIHIAIDIAVVEGQVFQQMVQKREFDIATPSWIADFDDPGNFLDLLKHDSGENYAGYDNPRYDALLAAADRAADPLQRAGLLRDAEQLALDDRAWVPAYFMVTRDLVSPRVKGWLANPRDMNRTRWLSLAP